MNSLSPISLLVVPDGSSLERDVTQFLTDVGALEVHYAWHLKRFGDFFDRERVDEMTNAELDQLITAGELFRKGVKGEVELLPYHVELCAGNGQVPASLFDLVRNKRFAGIPVSAATVATMFLAQRLRSEVDEPEPLPQPELLNEYGVYVLSA